MCVQMLVSWLFYLNKVYIYTNLLDLEGLLDLYINVLLKIVGRNQTQECTGRLSKNT